MNSNPSLQLDPAVIGSLAGTLQFVLKKFLQNVDGMLPAQVVAYDRINKPSFVQVKPLIKILKTDGTSVSRDFIPEIPVFIGGGGGFFISYNLKPGDLGWISANDRDISLFIQNQTEAEPNTVRVKSFSDAVFYPSVLWNYVIAPEDAEGLILSSNDGNVKIVLTPDTITLTAPIISVICPLVTLTGNLQVNGNIAATGTITPGA